MAKNIVKVNEEEIRGYMVGNIPDAIEKEDVIVVEVPAEETDKRPDKEKETASENPEPHPKRKSESGFRQKYLVNTPMPGRIQVYLNRKLYDEIKNYLNVIAPEVSIASYISNIIAEHIELNIEEITRMYKDRFHPLKFNSHGNNINLFSVKAMSATYILYKVWMFIFSPKVYKFWDNQLRYMRMARIRLWKSRKKRMVEKARKARYRARLDKAEAWIAQAENDILKVGHEKKTETQPNPLDEYNEVIGKTKIVYLEDPEVARKTPTRSEPMKRNP